MEEPVVNVQLTIAQAEAVSLACEVLTRLGIGQLEFVAELAQNGTIPMHADSNDKVRLVDGDIAQKAHALMLLTKQQMGFPRSGSRGIGHAHNVQSVRRAYEVQKVLDKVVAEHRDPNPSFRNVRHDGLTVRYTNDPAPVARILENA